MKSQVLKTNLFSTTTAISDKLEFLKARTEKQNLSCQVVRPVDNRQGTKRFGSSSVSNVRSRTNLRWSQTWVGTFKGDRCKFEDLRLIPKLPILCIKFLPEIFLWSRPIGRGRPGSGGGLLIGQEVLVLQFPIGRSSAGVVDVDGDRICRTFPLGTGFVAASTPRRHEGGLQLWRRITRHFCSCFLLWLKENGFVLCTTIAVLCIAY